MVDTWPVPLDKPLCPNCDEEARHHKDDRYVCAPCFSTWTIPGISKRIATSGFWTYQCVYCLTKYWGSYFGPLQICPGCSKRQPDAKGGNRDRNM